MHIYLDEKEIRQAIDAWCQHRLRMAVKEAEAEGIVFYAEDESYVAMGAKVEVEVPEIGRDVPVGDQSQSDRPGDRPEGQSPRGPRAQRTSQHNGTSRPSKTSSHPSSTRRARWRPT